MLVNFINKSVFVGNVARPISCLVEPERLWFTNSLIWSSFDTFHLTASKSLVRFSKSLSDIETLLVCFSRFLIALFTRLTYSSRLSFLFNPKSETGEIEISSSSSLLKRAFILLKRSGVNSLERILNTVSIIFSLIKTKIYNSIENTSLMNREGFQSK